MVNIGEKGTVHVVDLTSSPVAVTKVQGQRRDLCGATVAAVDVDGDGRNEILTSCIGGDRAHVGAFGEDGVAVLRLAGGPFPNPPYSWFGREAAAGFDLDRDGQPDLALGEGHVRRDDLASALRVVLGPWRGECSLSDVGALTLWSDFRPVATVAGDIDGDGIVELLVGTQGAPRWPPNVPEERPGRVAVLRDTPPNESQIADLGWLTLNGQDPGEGFGAALAVGDFNGDGCADIAVGAPGHDLAAPRPGRVYAFFGPFSPGNLSLADAVLLMGTHDGDFFGWPLAVGDYNGDGVDDLAISAIYDGTEGLRVGAVHVVAGGG